MVKNKRELSELRIGAAGSLSGPSLSPFGEAPSPSGRKRGAAHGRERESGKSGVGKRVQGKPLGKEEIRRAAEVLKKYQAGKQALEKRCRENEQWWKLRHWGSMKQVGDATARDNTEYESAWLWNCLANKHADAMDNYPEPVVLPREAQDKTDAEELSQIMPVIMEQNNFEATYDRNWWKKLISGTGIYGVFWNPLKENGMGDIEIRKVDLLNIFWEPGVDDIQKSPNLFVVELWDRESLGARYPQALEEVAGAKSITVGEYLTDDPVDTTEKMLVVDWYYREEDATGRTVLHYCKFCGETVLFATENEAEYKERGLYDHGKYPFVLDALFPVEGSPAGYSYVDIAKKPQMQIDTLNKIILKNAMMCGKKRWFVKNTGGINEEEYGDWAKDFVHVEGGGLGEESIREISVSPVDGFIVQFQQAKIDELKETSGNRDFSQGGTTAGVTAASAIAQLQEAAGKLSRDMIRQTYRAMNEVYTLVLELIRQFYDTPRCFRITGKDGENQYVNFQNARMQPQPVELGFGLAQGERRPVFDIKIRSQRANPYSTISQNELMLQLYGAGLFAPQMADQALVTLEGMQFENKQQILQKVQNNGTLYQQLMALQEQMAKMAAIIDAQNGTSITAGMAAEQQGRQGGAPAGGKVTVEGDNSVAEQARERTAMTTRV